MAAKKVEALAAETIEEVEKYVQDFTEAMMPKSADRSSLADMLAACFRVLRNACAGCRKNQECIRLVTFEATKAACDVLLTDLQMLAEGDRKSHAGMVCLRCAVQFLGNAVTSHEGNQQQVWDIFGQTLRRLLLLDDEKLCDYTCMVLFSCGGERLEKEQDLFRDVLSVLVRFHSDWAAAVLELVHDKLKSGDGRGGELAECGAVHPSNVLSAASLFKADAKEILGLTHQQLGDLDPVTVTQVLSILCTATSQRDCYKEILDDADVLKCTIHLLHCMEMVGKSGENAFSSVTKLSEMEKTDHSAHPVFGLKSNLIRLISNMVYKHRANQDLARELGGIQLIMNHTNIDGRNPFITQWAVFAMRNLLEENHDNQAVVAEMKLQGVADNIDALREFGVEAEMQGDKIVVKQVTDPQLNDPSPFSKHL